MRFRLVVLLMFLPLLRAHAGSAARAYELVREAAVLIKAQRYAPAMQLLREADALDGVPDLTRTEIVCGMMRAAIGQGDFVQANALYGRGMEYSPDEQADDMLRLTASEVCFATGDYDRSLALLDSVVTPSYGGVCAAHRVRALTMLGRHAEAIATADAALAAAGADRSVLLQNRGYARWEAGDLFEAAADLSEAAAAMPAGADRLNTLGNLAVVESELGWHKQAIAHIDEAVAGLPASTPDGTVARRKRAEILRRAGRRAEADAAFRRYFAAEKKALQANLPQMSASERLNYWVKEKALLSRCFAEGTDPVFLYDVATFRRLTSLLGMRDTSRMSAWLGVDASKVRRALRPDEAAVEIVAYEPERGRRVYAAAVLPARGAARFVPLISDDELYAPESVGTNSIYNALRRESAEEKNALYADTAIADRVWQPILRALPASVRTIYFAPEGIFHLWGIENMPFSGRDRYEVHRVSATAALTSRGASAASGGKSLVVGGLDYDALPGDTARASGNSEAAETMRARGAKASFGYLKGTRAEADSIARLRGAAARHTMGEAELKALMPGYDIVHIATHGYSLNFGVRRRPEFMADSVAVDRSLAGSGLALSGANRGYSAARGEDGLLSAREICDMDLSGVDFVVLSACRTALGDVSDEGAAGLVRGLKMAGVRTIVASLWEVDDMSTMLFMQALHRELAAGASPREAFGAAQRRVREESVTLRYRRFSPATMARERRYTTRLLPPFAEPYYWAPFILIDDF